MIFKLVTVGICDMGCLSGSCVIELKVVDSINA